MIEVEGEIKKWGNSLALRLSKKDLKKTNFRVNQKVKVLLIPETDISKEIFGTLKFKKSTDQMMREVDEGW